MSHQRCASMIAEPSSSCRRFAADACWPRNGRSAWICGQEARPCAVERLDGHRAGDVCRDLEPPRANEAERADGCHELRAVDEGQPLLRVQHHRLEPDGGQRLAAGQQPSFDPGIAFAHERQREVSERCEVAARADGASTRHDREHAAVRALDQQLHELDPGAGVALRERVRPQQHRRAHDLAADTALRPRTHGCAGDGAGALRSAQPGWTARRTARSPC